MTKNYTIHQGNNIDILKTLEDNSIDSIVTDPPYGIDFLGKDWDANTGALETYQECLRVLKPGGYILAFSAARTYHYLAITLEQAGFEIRDQLMWLYASGFPKAQDIGKAIDKRLGKKDNTVAQQWSGWKTALKPSHEPIAMARKPFKGSCLDNVLTHGVGALNIDATRIPLEDNVRTSTTPNHIQKNSFETINTDEQKTFNWSGDPVGFVPNEAGRFPSNVIGEVAEEYQKYFYCPKVSRKERHTGFEAPPDPLANYSLGDVKNHPLWDPSIGTNVQRLKHKILEHNKDLGKKHDPLGHIPTNPEGMYNVDGTGQQYNSNKYKSVGNNHPTVKPVALMKYLIKLVTPKGGTVLDPFTGSGSTGMAAVELGYDFIGCELDPTYVEIANKRIEAWTKSNNTFEELFTEDDI